MSDETTTAPVQGDGVETTPTTVATPPAKQPAAEPSKAPARDDENKGMVPYSRLAAVIEERNKAISQAAEAETYRSKYTEIEKQREVDRLAWKEERAFLSAGVSDPEAVEIARMFYGRLPAEDRPEIADWLTEIKADPTKAPRALQPYLAPAPAETDNQARGPHGVPVRAPAPAATGRPAPASGSVTVEALRAAREKATRSNAAEDWAAFRTLSAAAQAARNR